MASFDAGASWFSRASSRRDRFSESSHELPRWHTPPPMVASTIPPPIVQSTYDLAPSRAAASVATIAPQPTLPDSREEDLHADLQFLLDAQAEGLLRGIGSGEHENGRSTGSTTPTARSLRSPSAKRSVRRKPGLRSARKGLYNTIVALSDVKSGELENMDASVAENESKIAKIDSWEHKRRGLREASSSVEEGEEVVRAQRLQQEADSLQEGINEVELELADMKVRHKKLVRQIASAENTMQARLASYTQSMNMLEADVQKFLSQKPPPGESRPRSSDGHASVWQLPPKQRTIEAAREHFTEEHEATLQEKKKIEKEQAALMQGAVMWKEVAVTVTEFEKRVRAEMAGQSASLMDSNHAWDDTPQGPPEERMKELLQHMDTVIDTLKAKLDTAEEQHWNLLIAAIGAELDALRKGKQILEGALGQAEPGHESAKIDQASSDPLASAGGEEIRELDNSFETARRRSVSNGDTDDEPDPELLFSRQDTDTE